MLAATKPQVEKSEKKALHTLSHASLKYRAASSIAPPNRGPIVRRPIEIEHNKDHHNQNSEANSKKKH